MLSLPIFCSRLQAYTLCNILCSNDLIENRFLLDISIRSNNIPVIDLIVHIKWLISALDRAKNTGVAVLTTSLDVDAVDYHVSNKTIESRKYM